MFSVAANIRITLQFLVCVCIWLSSSYGQTFYKSPYSLSDAPHHYRDRDQITSVHECTHGVNSMLRNQYGMQCFYVGNKRFVRFPRTGIRLSQLAQRIEYRGMAYQLYLVQQQKWWDDTALYTFDEWTSYTNGAAVAVYKRVGGQHWSDVQQACEFGYYTFILVDLTPTTYTQKAELGKFWQWQAKRCVDIADTAEKTSTHYRPSIRPWREWLRSRLKKKPAG